MDKAKQPTVLARFPAQLQHLWDSTVPLPRILSTGKATRITVALYADDPAFERQLNTLRRIHHARIEFVNSFGQVTLREHIRPAA